MFVHFDAEYDFANRKFNLFSQKHCPGTVVYWADDYAKLPLKTDWSAQISTDGQLDGQPVDILFDTGSTWSTMSPDKAKTFGWDGKMDSLIKTPSKDGNHFSYFYPFKSLELHGINIAHPKIIALQPGIKSKEDMILGMNVLSRLHIYIAYAERAMYVTGANARRADAPKP